MLTQVLCSLRDRNNLDTELIDEVVIGCVSPLGEQGNNIARIAALNAGYAQRVPGFQLNRFCASGLSAVNMAASLVMSGQCELTVGGGVESMSRLPIDADAGAWVSDPRVAAKTHYVPQGIGADLIATKWGFSREDLDGYALESQKRAGHAWERGFFNNSILPVKDVLGREVLARDEHMRPATSLDDLAQLKPAFTNIGALGFDSIALQRYPEVERIEHLHTGGSSSGIVDGAAGVVIGSADVGKKLGIAPRARIRAFASVGSEPAIMLTGPTPSAEMVLKRAGMSKSDIDLFELNEAFASVVLLYMKQMDIAHDKINVNGGAIAMGHPLGATGAMILGTVLDELERRDECTALVNLCVGAGMGTATIIERV